MFHNWRHETGAYKLLSLINSHLCFIASKNKSHRNYTVYQFWYKLYSLWTLTQTLVYQRFYICFMMSKVIGNNSHTSSCLSTLLSILVSSRASWVETTLTQTLVYQLSYKRLSLNSHTNSCLSILIQTLVYQFSYTLLSINYHANALVYINSHTNSCLSTLICVSSRARWIETTLIQTLVYSLSYKWELSYISRNNPRIVHNSRVSRNNSCHARLWFESKRIDILSIVLMREKCEYLYIIVSSVLTWVQCTCYHDKGYNKLFG